MDELILHPTPTAQWYALVNEAQRTAGKELSEDLESYLVFCLMRFVQKPDIAAAILALEYLESLQQAGSLQQDKLRDLGDVCLLYSGLFPYRAKRKRVHVGYFADLGRSAYHQLSQLLNHRAAQVYQELVLGFSHVSDVLKAMRDTQGTEILPVWNNEALLLNEKKRH